MRILTTAVVIAALAVAPAIHAQQPEVLHAQVSTQSAGNLASTIDSLEHQTGPLWIGYAVPTTQKFSAGWGNDQVAYLENDHNSGRQSTGDEAKQTFDHTNILFRIEAGAITKLRFESPNRQLDAGGLRFVWLTNANPNESVQLLNTLASAKTESHLRDSAIFAISIHAAPSATTTLIELASPGNDLRLREKSAFWLANQRGHDGLSAIEHLSRTDADPEFREKLAFDLTLSKEPEALTELIRMAHEDASPDVRKRAQFWMAAKGGKLVTANLTDAAENDPNEQVRRSAVFALSRLPAPDAVTQLIHVAETNKDPIVRRQAVFWLGQSQDPRALDYLTHLLKQ
ncbi:hypothetical protein GCM10011507_20290 [Edaphobacter acidisoli]|uniref:HEAT repeat domain-containing protein n=1 Tax=Edaphobacter acidisoli TaxID=2040573 RepID=A0A916RUX7_9BACT|nr:HEAT repeat domain-containing protein [Edaphobacter acidisoli]GGA68764.1 hypothetical protein GCM10011507_20290 [Edaphobacter acidisoli]